ncbi:MAG: hypothetical protein V4584_07845 [Verrucomicrobiota bacterium]
MKLIKPLILFLTVAAGACYAAFTLPWSTLDGGGGKSSGTSTGGTVYTLTGTIGQFDTTAAPAAGAPHTLTGGFWAQLVGSEDPVHPKLSLVRFPNGDASIQWQSDAAGWQMESSINLTHWSNVGGPITTAGAVTLPYNPNIPKQFFRLRNP